MTLKQYDRKYRHLKYRLLVYTKKEVEEFDRINKPFEKNYLLKGRKWCLIDDTYYEIPRAPRFVWFRNLNCAIQFGVCILGVGVISTGIIVPTYIHIINTQKKSITTVKEGDGKDLVKDLKLTKQDDGSYTGKIELKEGAKKEDIGEISITVDGNTLTEGVDYTLDTSSGEIVIKPNIVKSDDSKIVITIKKAEPIEEFTITFNTRVEEKIDPVVVKKGEVVTQPKDPYKQYCKVKYWYKGDDKNTPYDFSSPVTESFTLSAYYTAIETKVKVYGLKGLDSFDTIDELITKGGEAISNCLGGLGAEQITSAEIFKNTFTDVVETDEEINATLTYELYTKEGETHSIFRTSPEYTYSLGRKNNFCGVDATSQKKKMFIDKIVLKSGCDDKARLYYQERKTYAATDPDKDLTAMRRNETYKHRSSYVFEMLDIDNFEIQHQNAYGDNMSLFLIKNDPSNDAYIYGHYFDFESCNFNQTLTMRACKNLTINNCYFYQDLEKPKTSTHMYATNDSAIYLFSSLLNDDHEIVFTNNVIDNYPRGIHLQDYSATKIEVKNNKFQNVNKTAGQGGNVCLNIAKNATNCVINVENNTFKDINCNTLKVHSAIDDSYPYVHVNNNEFLSCKYLGWSKADKTKYSLDSKDNIRDEETDITKCEIADDGTTSSDEKDLIILNWKE